MLKKIITTVLSILFIISFTVFSSAAEINGEVIDGENHNNPVIVLQDGHLEFDGTALIHVGSVNEVDFMIKTSDALSMFYKTDTFTPGASEFYTAFKFYGAQYGVLNITVTLANVGVSADISENYIYTDTGTLNNVIVRNYVNSDGLIGYIFTIDGYIPDKFTIRNLFYGVEPTTLLDENPFVCQVWYNASFIADYGYIGSDIINNDRLNSEAEMSNANKNKDEIISNQNQNSQNVINNQNQNTQDIINNQNQLQQNEKNEADSSADEGLNSILDGVEDKSPGVIAAFTDILIPAISYTGYEAKLQIPDIYLPEISGVMDKINLTEDLEVDFNFWINKLPDNILKLVRALGTIGLIIFCFKEFYSTFSYVFTLTRGGGSDE